MSTKREEQTASIVDWFTACGVNGHGESLDQILASTTYAMCQEMTVEGWEVPHADVTAVARGEWDSSLDWSFDSAVDYLRERAKNA